MFDKKVDTYIATLLHRHNLKYKDKPVTHTIMNKGAYTMASQNDFKQAVANMEQALADALKAAVTNGNTQTIERILKLVIKKEIILELLVEEFSSLEEKC